LSRRTDSSAVMSTVARTVTIGCLATVRVRSDRIGYFAPQQHEWSCMTLLPWHKRQDEKWCRSRKAGFDHRLVYTADPPICIKMLVGLRRGLK